MKSILAITYCFPPIFVPATICYIKCMKGLIAHEYKVCVLSIDPNSFNSMDSNFNKIDQGLLKIVPDEIVNRTVWSLEKKYFFKIIKKFKIFYQLYEPFKMEWYYPAIRCAKKLKEYDIILSCSKPDSCHLVGYYLKKITGKPWIAYFSDPWTDNPYMNYRSEKIYKYNLKLENRVINNADRILFTTEATRNLIMKKYPDHFLNKTGVIPHSFVPEWYDYSKEVIEKKHNKIRVVHTGHFYGPRTPMPLFKNLFKLKGEMNNISEKIEFLFFGTMEQTHQKFILENRLDDLVKIYKTVPYVQSLNLIKSADYLLVIDAPLTTTKESIFLPSKLVDYIGSYNRVIGITPEKGECADLLRNTGNIVCDIQDEGLIFRTFKHLIENNVAFRLKKEGINRYHYKNVAKDFSNIIQKIKD